MITEIVTGKDGVEIGARLIKEGKLVAFPTETVYGLGADAFNENAVMQSFKIKGRPADNPLIVHLSGIAEIDRVAENPDPAAIELFKIFSPGPLTILFRKGRDVPYAVTAGRETVAVRIPAHPLTAALIKACGVPITGPSANLSTHVSPTSAAHVYDDLAGLIPMILDGGECSVGIESTVLDMTSEVPTILRPGYITAEMLAPYLVGVRTHTGQIVGSAPAPGMKYKHYSPRVPVTVVRGGADRLSCEYFIECAEGRNPVVIAVDGILKAMAKEINRISLGSGEKQAAQKIYGALREAEKNYGAIICQYVEGEGVAASIMNRVLKAAGGKTV